MLLYGLGAFIMMLIGLFSVVTSGLEGLPVLIFAMSAGVYFMIDALNAESEE